jgi:urea carboxylase-associated protein 2
MRQVPSSDDWSESYRPLLILPMVLSSKPDDAQGLHGGIKTRESTACGLSVRFFRDRVIETVCEVKAMSGGSDANFSSDASSLPSSSTAQPLTADKPLSSAKSMYADVIPGGAHWSLVMRRGHVLRLIDQDGGTNVGMLFYNPGNPLERYNAPDTLKCQHTFKLTRGHCLYSDMGRIFCSIVDDTRGWHDTVGGNSNRDIVKRKWGERRYQEYRNARQQNGHDSFLVELAKYGLGRRDLAANVNFFSKVAVDTDGNLIFDAHHGSPGDYVDLRFEMDTLVLLHTCPHPLDPATEYPRKSLAYQIFDAPPIGEGDPCKFHCPENERGFENNRLYHQLNNLQSHRHDAGCAH